MSDLKPCPFCKESAELQDPIDPLFDYEVSCSECTAEVSGATEAEAIAAWNTRPSPWIPVGERMPEAFEDDLSKCVFVMDEEGDFGSGCYGHIERAWHISDGVDARTITHWQMPEAP